MNTVKRTSFISFRFIKPNCSQQSNTFDENSVMKQLEAAGILDVTKIRREGYPVRLPLDIFAERYLIYFVVHTSVKRAVAI